LEACEAILAIFPEEGDILIARANLLRRLSRRDEAVAAVWQAVGLGHDRPEIWIDGAAALIDLNRLTEARSLIDQALRRDPRHPRTWIVLGELLRKQQKDPAAEPCFRRAAALAEGDAVPRLRLAQILSGWGRYDEAASLFDQAHQRNGGDLDAISGFAQALISQGRLAESIPHIQRVLAANPDHLDARLGAARALLLSGNLTEGWPAYEARRRRSDLKMPKLHGPEWDGSPLAGKTLVVYAEQGFGDVIQFVRYIPLLAAQAAKVVLIVTPHLLALCKSVESDNVSVRTELANLPPYDFHIPLLSVPWRLEDHDWAKIPATVPYLQVPADKSASIAAPAGTRLKVGLVWAGSPTHANDAHRSAGLRALLPLTGVAGVTFYSLQVGPRAPDLAAEAHHALIEPVAPKLKDYGDTAAVIDQLDLVISVDTSVVHLAGALGKPAWVMIPYAPDWRWLLHREETPWYPTLRLFRQSAPNNWDDVVERLVAELTALAASRPEATCDEATAAKAQALFLAGLKHQEAGKLEKALDAYTQSATLDRRNPDLFNNLGVALQSQGRIAAAEACYRRASALRPEDVGCLSNLGSALRLQGKYAEAETVYNRARALAPTQPRPVFNAGHLYRDMGRPEEAQACFEQTLALEPDNKEALWDRALAQLQKGDYANGFQGYETRWGLKSLTKRPVALPLWDGGPLEGRSLYLQDEQGFGDALQFARFIPEVKRRGAGKVILECQPELMRLFALMPGVDAVVGRHAGTPGCACYAPLLSLPGILGITLDDLPGPVPYLQAPSATVPLPTDGRLKVGLVWAGKDLPKDRSCPLDKLLPLLGDPRLDVYSLQVGPRAAELKACGADAFITDLAPRLHDFAETAAVLKDLDLLVTVDTSVAHLAGALAVPTLTLLHFASDWRWFDFRPDSPWYPTMRLIRQVQPNRWEEALAELAGAVREFSGSSVLQLVAE